MIILNALAPVVLIVLLGVLLRRFDFISESVLSGLNRLTYWVALPSLLFSKIAAPDLFGTGFSGGTLLILLAGMCGCLLLALAVAKLAKIPAPSAGAFLTAAFRGNLAYVGLPIILFSAADSQPGAVARIETTAILTLGSIVPIYNLLAVVVLLAAGQKLTWPSVRKVGVHIILNPLLLACLLGITASVLQVRLPVALQRALAAVAQMALPLALLALGGILAGVDLRGELFRASLAGSIKIVAGPVFGYLAAAALGTPPQETFIAMIYLATPAAVTTYVMADQLGNDAHLAARAVVLSTIAAFVPLSAIVAFF